jgi:hypothetical protein
MNRFPDHPSPEFAKAIKGIESLAKVAGVDTCRDAFATATADLVVEEFGTRNGVVPARGSVCIQRVLGKKCQDQYRFCPCKPPGAEHASLWARDGEPKYYVTEHYRLDRSRLENAAEFAREHELEFEIVGGTGIHFPSKCFAIVYWNPKIPRF